MTRYSTSRKFLSAGLIAVGLAAFSGWSASQWTPAVIPAVLFLVSAGLMFFLATRPPIELHESHLAVGRRRIPWSDIRRLDRTGWVSPLAVHVGLADKSSLLIIFPGDHKAGDNLLRHLRRSAREALIDGIPYRQFWGENIAPAAGKPELTPPRYPLLCADDEAEVERLYQRLKAVGHLDPKNSPDEK